MPYLRTTMSMTKQKRRKRKKERCQSCETSVKIGEYLKVCKRVGTKKECKILMNKILDEKITPTQLYRKVRKKVKKGSREEKALKEIDKVMKEIADES